MKESLTVGERRRYLTVMRRRYHRTCPACGVDAHNSLCSDITVSDNGHLEICVTLGKDTESYTGHVHGGTVASLLDCAMTNCLFSYSIAAVTGQLNVRMLNPVLSNTPTLVRANLNRSLARMFVLSAELLQNENVCARSEGRFIKL